MGEGDVVLAVQVGSTKGRPGAQEGTAVCKGAPLCYGALRAT